MKIWCLSRSGVIVGSMFIPASAWAGTVTFEPIALAGDTAPCGTTFSVVGGGVLNATSDANHHQVINILDFGALAGGFGSLVGWSGGNFDGKDTTNILDFGLLAGNFGQDFRASGSIVWNSATPEPQTLVCFAGGCAADDARSTIRDASWTVSSNLNHIPYLASETCDHRAQQ